MARPTGRDIRSEAMAAARAAIQSDGARGFSYGGIAATIGVRAPSIHHHFPRKDELIRAATRAYREEFRNRVGELEQDSPVERLDAYVELFLSPARQDLFCLCGAVAADWADLDEATRSEVDAFFADEIAWVEAQIRDAVDRAELDSAVEPLRFAIAFVAGLEGALLLARTGLRTRAVLDAAAQLIDLARPRP